MAAWIVAFGPVGGTHAGFVPTQASLPQLPLT
jgi:hypothetical protein